MATITVNVRLKLDQAETEIRRRAARAVAKAAHDIEAGAKARAPVDTGLLRNSIRADQHGPYHWTVTSPVSYSVFQEYGTRYMGAQPYMTPALEAVIPSLRAALRRLAA